MDAIDRLLAIEEIKALKGKYFYFFDHKQWARWKSEVFAPDARFFVPELREEPFEGLDDIIAWTIASAADQISVHHGHTPIIEITSASTATGIWAMEDRLYRTREHPLHDGSSYLHGFGHYHETYVRLAAGWRIQSTRLTRLRVERVHF